MGTSLTMPKNSKSSSGLYDSLRYSAGVAAMPMWNNNKVWPSGAALATRLAPMVPPAPAVFSTTKLLPGMSLRMASAKSRATRSVGPPAVNGTTMATGLLPGKDWAWAPTETAAKVASAIHCFIDKLLKVTGQFKT